MDFEEDRWWQEYERNREDELEWEDEQRRRAIERLYEKGDAFTGMGTVSYGPFPGAKKLT